MAETLMQVCEDEKPEGCVSDGAGEEPRDAAERIQGLASGREAGGDLDNGRHGGEDGQSGEGFADDGHAATTS
jgi:hypothetical protein